MINKIKVGTSKHNIVPVLSDYLFESTTQNPLRLHIGTSDNDYGLTIAVSSGIASGAAGLYINAQPPLFAEQYELKLKLDGDSSGLAAGYNGLRVQIGSGLTVDSYGIGIKLKDTNGPLTIEPYGLKFLIANDIYTNGAVSQHCSLDTNYGLKLRLSNYTATPSSEKTYIGNAITPTEYGLSLKIGTGLLVEQNALDVKLSFVTQLSGGEQIPNNAIMVIPGEGFGAPGITLKLQERVINGRSQTLLTTIDGGLDIDIDALKLALGLS